MRNTILTILISITFAFYAYSEEITKIVAKVNNQVVTAKDLDDYYKMLTYRTSDDTANNAKPDDEKGKKDALEKLIEDKLILAEAKKEQLQTPSYLVDNQLNKIISAYPSRQDFEKSLIERGLNITLLKERISGQFLMRQIINNYVSRYISVSPQEISDYYEQHKKEINSPELYSLWIGENSDKNLLTKIAEAIRKDGISVAEKEYPQTMFKLETNMGELREEIAGAVKNLKQGESTIKSVGKLNYLIYFDKIIPSHPLTLTEAQENIYNILWNAKFKQRFNEWVNQLKEKAFIKTYL